MLLGAPLLSRAAPRTGVGNAARAFHTPPRPTSSWLRHVTNTRNTVTRLLSQAIQSPFLSGVRAHASSGPSISRSIPSPSIRQSLSLPARIALSRPLGAPYLPRPPTVPRNITQVGLGTARNFSTARPIFQNLVQNVPAAGRAFYEVDWDIKLQREKENMRMIRKNRQKGSNEGKGKGPAVKPAPRKVEPAAADQAELEHYFPEPQYDVTTYVQIPLAPTPTARRPLAARSSSQPRLLPLPTLAKQSISHSDHSKRVITIFRKLDAARVWDRGAQIEPWGDASGLCTILLISFTGWSKEMVQEVLGEADMEWCTIEESAIADSDTDSITSSMMDSFPASSPPVSPSLTVSPLQPLFVGREHDGSIPEDSASIEFVIPTLDFSSSFLATHSIQPSPRTMFSTTRSSPDESDFEVQSVSSDDSDSSGLKSWTSSISPTPSANSISHGWMGFSSDFAARATRVAEQEFIY